MKIDGACHCGAIKIEGEADPEKSQICHCTDCQTCTGLGVPRVDPGPRHTFKMTGQPTIYVKTTADSGKPRVQAFCGKCGSPIYSTTPGEGVQPSYTVRVGILRQRDQLHAAAAELVPLGALLGHQSRCGAEKREAGPGLKCQTNDGAASTGRRQRCSHPP